MPKPAIRGCRHLLELGHKDIALLVTVRDLANIRETALAGYRLRARRARLRGSRTRRHRRRHDRGLPRRDRTASARPRPPDGDLRRVLCRHARRDPGHPRRRPGVSRGRIPARFRRLRLDDGAAALCEHDPPAGRRDGEPCLDAADVALRGRQRRRPCPPSLALHLGGGNPPGRLRPSRRDAGSAANKGRNDNETTHTLASAWPRRLSPSLPGASARADEAVYGVLLKTLSNPFWGAMERGHS